MSLPLAFVLIHYMFKFFLNISGIFFSEFRFRWNSGDITNLSFATCTFISNLSFYPVYLSNLSFTLSTFLLSLPFNPVYLLNLSFTLSTFLSSLPFYQIYLLNLSFTPSRPKYYNRQKFVKMFKNYLNNKTRSTKRLCWSDQLISWIGSDQLIWSARQLKYIILYHIITYDNIPQKT